jgi:hypothetical protein
LCTDARAEQFGGIAVSPCGSRSLCVRQQAVPHRRQCNRKAWQRSIPNPSDATVKRVTNEQAKVRLSKHERIGVTAPISIHHQSYRSVVTSDVQERVERSIESQCVRHIALDGAVECHTRDIRTVARGIADAHTADH